MPSFCIDTVAKELPFELACVHVNHQLREAGADADETYVKTFCEMISDSL